MWLGTINGLNRYNGKEFTVMLPETGNLTSLTDNRIRSIMEDDHGYIWVRTVANTYNCYNPRTECFIDFVPENRQKNFTYIRKNSNGDIWLWGKDGGCCRIRHQEDKLHALYLGEPELGAHRVSFIYEDLSRRTWIGTAAGIYLFENDDIIKIDSEAFLRVHEAGEHLFFISNKHIVPYDLKRRKFLPPLPYPSIDTVSVDITTQLRNGIVLMATKNGIFAFDCLKMKFISSESLFNNEKIHNANFYTDNNGDKWVYNLSGNLWRQVSNNTFEKITLMPKHILSTLDAERYEICHDSRGIIWITTYGNGLFAIDTNTQEIYHYTVDNSELPTNYLLCVTEDKSGEIWVGTEFSGISKISRNDYPVQIFLPAPNDKSNWSNAVRMIYQDSKERFWIGTRNGYLHVYDSSFKLLKSHRIENSLPFCAAEDSAGNVWIGTRGKGLRVFPSSGGTAVRQYSLRNIPSQNIGSDNVFGMTIDSKNRIWIASFGGGLHYADIGKPEIKFHHIGMQTPTQNRIRAIVQDRNGVIWASTNEGLIAFNPDEIIRDNRKYDKFRFNIHDENSINSNEIKVIYEDRQGRLWFGTTGGGLNLLVRENPLENSRFKHYTT
jgi:ligand-binding sensor domain-containing protein